MQMPDIGKRLANYIYRYLSRTITMHPSLIGMERMHHGCKRIEKADQPPALA
jgi:hypothetical protein